MANTWTRDDLRDPIVPGKLPLSRDNHAECTMTACFEPRRFRSTVPYYARYRVPYPAPLISFVHERCGLRAGSRVLDLGCGPGQLAVAFATLGCAVTAMDPEP